MKYLTVALLLIFAVSGFIHKAEADCLFLDEPCNDDSECCDRYCVKSFRWFHGYCANITLILEEKYTENYQEGMCSYYKSNDTDRKTLFASRFGIHAAHDTLAPDTKVKVAVPGSPYPTVVTISSLSPTVHGTLLDLSDEAAQLLNIKTEGKFPCNIAMEDRSIFRYLVFFIPAALVVYGFKFAGFFG